MMANQQKLDNASYRIAMGRLLVLYTQVDYLIMCACAERIAKAPNDETRLALGKQVGDESKHVRIQQQWMQDFGTDNTPVINDTQQALFLAHFRSLSWLDFLTDMYICVEALGSEAVEQIVPLADPGTRQSLHTPLLDELDHVAFGLGELKKELGCLSELQRQQYINSIPSRLDFLDDTLHGMGLDIPAMFNAVGADYSNVVAIVLQRRQEILDDLVLEQAA